MVARPPWPPLHLDCHLDNLIFAIVSQCTKTVLCIDHDGFAFGILSLHTAYCGKMYYDLHAWPHDICTARCLTCMQGEQLPAVQNAHAEQKRLQKGTASIPSHHCFCFPYNMAAAAVCSVI